MLSSHTIWALVYQMQLSALDACFWKCSPYIFHLMWLFSIYFAHRIVDLAAIVCVLCLPGSGRWVCNLIYGILMPSQSDRHENLWILQIMSTHTWYTNIPMVVAYQFLNAVYSRKKRKVFTLTAETWISESYTCCESWLKEWSSVCYEGRHWIIWISVCAL